MAGGGSSAIILPMYLWLGISLPQTYLITRICGLIGAPFAARNYLQKRSVDWTFLLLFTFIGLLGAYVGVLAITKLNQRVMEVFLGVLILLIVAYISLMKEVGLKEVHVPQYPSWVTYVFAPFLGFNESVGSANGLIFAAITMKTRGFDFKDALGHYYLMATFWTFFALLFLLQYRIEQWSLLVAGILGSIAGNHSGSAFAAYKGNKFIKVMFGVVGTLLGLKLILNF
jgi:uncharacterized membrane protein YfcA